MNNTVDSRTELKTLKSFKRNSKVDIKEICKKFENLSGSVDHTVDIAETSTPIVPARRKKCNYVVDNNKSSFRTSTDLKSPSPLDELALHGKRSSTGCLNVKISVKEKTKLFESSASVDNFSNTTTANIKKVNNFPITAKSENSKDVIAKNCEKTNATYVNTPPAKPPRSFLHSEISQQNNSKDNFDVYRKSLGIDIKERPSFKSEFVTRNTSSFSFETNVRDPAHKNSRLGSAPEIFCASAPKPLELTPKTIKSAGKTQVFFNYLKNISNTANKKCEKVKQKHSNIFVDLTPTTVSPPKHYGTLKRSLSEEHIYAEPATVHHKSRENSPVIEPLHYMCSSLIPPSLPQRQRTEETKPVSNVSVKNMIYSSFAGVRDLSKEISENASSNIVIDSCEPDLSTKAIQDRIMYVKSVRKQVSSSSLCLAPKLYEALFVINVIEDQPQVVHTFPLKIDAEYNIPLLPHICFPSNDLYKSVPAYQSEVFHFSLIDNKETTFGYCLRIQGWPEAGLDNESLCMKVPVAICILSSFSAPVFYRKLLFEIEKHLTLPRNLCFKYIRSLRKLGVPNAGASLSIPDCSEQNDDTKRIVVSRPLDSHFVGFEMTRALQLLDVEILVKCVASLFLERRILFFSSSVSNLYHCCKAIASLLYPFEWPHQFVPVLPACLTIHCCSDQPYIIGIVNNNCESVLELLSEHELLIIDIDKGCVIKSCNDEDTILPKKVQKALISALNLAKNMTDPTEMMRDIMISEAFVHMSVEMIGNYENYFSEVNGNVTFHKEGFLKNAFSHNIRLFLQWFTETQMFDAFIEDSLWRIKYRSICQTNMRTFFEKRVDEYKWELHHSNEKLSRFIGKTVRNFGEMLKGLKKC